MSEIYVYGSDADSNIWLTTIPAVDSDKKYLWNYKIIARKNKTGLNTDSKILYTYDGTRQVSSIANHYLASASSSGVTISTSGWSTNIPKPTSTKKYLWNYITINYTSGNSTNTEPEIIDNNGTEIKSITDYYQTSSYDESGFDNMGLVGALLASECTFSETANGESTIELTHPLDEYGKYLALQKGNILSIGVPVRVTPEFMENVDEDGSVTDTRVTTVWTYTAKPIAELAGKAQLYMYTKVKGGKKKCAVKSGDNVTVTWKFDENNNPKNYERWKARYDVQKKKKNGTPYTQTYTGYINPLGYNLKETKQIGDNSSAIQEVIEPWSITEQYFRIYEVVKSIDSVKVSARHIRYDLLYNLTRYRVANSTKLPDALNGILTQCYAEHDFSAYTDVTNEQSALFYDNKNPINVFLDPEEGICKRYNVGMVSDNYELYFLNDPGINRGVTIRYGKNMTGIDFTLTDDEVVTRIVPLGENKDGSKLYLDDDVSKRYIDSPNHFNDYSVIHVKEVEVEGAKIGEKETGGTVNKKEAIARMRAFANKLYTDEKVDEPKVEMKVEFVNLGDTVEYEQYKDLENCFLFDYVGVVYDKQNINVMAQIVSIEWDCLLDRMKSVEIGKIGDRITDVGINTWQIPSGFSGSKLATGTVGTAAIATGAIVSSSIADGGISSNNISAGAITSGAIAPGAIIASSIGAGVINSTHIQTKSLNAESIAAGAVTAEKIAAMAITSEKIEAGAITAREIASNAVVAGKIDAGAVTAGTIAADAVKAGNIDAGAITAREITNVDYAQVTYIDAQTLNTESLIAHDGLTDRYYISKLQVDNAQLVNATVANLVVKASDDHYYKLDVVVDEYGNVGVEPRDVTVSLTQDEINAGITSDGSASIIETDILASNLGANNMKAINALIDMLNADRINVDSLFAREAFITKLETSVIQSDTAVNFIVGKVKVGSRNYLKNSKSLSGAEAATPPTGIAPIAGQAVVGQATVVSGSSPWTPGTVTIAQPTGVTVYDGTEQTVLQLSNGLDGSVKLTCLPYNENAPAFVSVWAKAASEMQVRFYALGTYFNKTIGTTWERIELEIKEPSGNDIYIMPMADTSFYLYEMMVEANSTSASDWVVAQEDTDDVINGIRKDTDDLLSVTSIRQDGVHVLSLTGNNEVHITNSSVDIKVNGETGGQFASNYVQLGNYRMYVSVDGGMAFKVVE